MTNGIACPECGETMQLTEENIIYAYLFCEHCDEPIGKIGLNGVEKKGALWLRENQ